jgi:hypothetical protein
MLKLKKIQKINYYSFQISAQLKKCQPTSKGIKTELTIRKRPTLLTETEKLSALRPEQVIPY